MIIWLLVHCIESASLDLSYSVARTTQARLGSGKEGPSSGVKRQHFHEPIQRLLKLWATNRRLSDKFHLHSRSSCAYLRPYQRSLNACYYNARGLFHLARGSPFLALSYFNEAHEQNQTSKEMHSNLGMALVAVRRSVWDEELETYLAIEKSRRPNPVVLNEGELGSFRMSYVAMDAR